MSLHYMINPKEPFKYYVIMFLTFLGSPTQLFDDVILEWSLKEEGCLYVQEIGCNFSQLKISAFISGNFCWAVMKIEAFIDHYLSVS